jgi:hypothetical protein
VSDPRELRAKANALRGHARVMLDEADELESIARAAETPAVRPKRRYDPKPTHDRPLSAEDEQRGRVAARRIGVA